MNMTNIMRTPEEKERIVKEYRNAPISLRGIAEKYKTSTRCILNWTNKYETLGIKGLQSATGKKCGSNKGQGPRKPKSREEELERKIMRLEIENARLKKGYLTKGDGVTKVYVTTLEKIMK